MLVTNKGSHNEFVIKVDKATYMNNSQDFVPGSSTVSFSKRKKQNHMEWSLFEYEFTITGVKILDEEFVELTCVKHFEHPRDREEEVNVNSPLKANKR